MIETTLTIKGGEKTAVTLKVEVPPESAPKPAAEPREAAPPPTGPSGRRIGAFVAGGVGVAGLILGGVMGALTLGKKGVIDARCNVGGIAAHCRPDGYAAAESAKTLGLVSTIGFGVGIAGVGMAAVLLLTEPSRPAGAVVSWRGGF